MRTILRHLISIVMLPFVVVVIVPYWLLHMDVTGLNAFTATWLFRFAAIIAAVIGLVLFIWCVALFVKVGRGTLSPWDPTRNLVAVGPYRFVRNPMISGVALLLIAQALLWSSWPSAIWAGIFILVNHIYFVLSEEPGLEQRFGEPYRVYKSSVPRWIPRLRPWSPSGAPSNHRGL
jgi:protein-S-isoprenylcysteine O-methyltransferase Ste14